MSDWFLRRLIQRNPITEAVPLLRDFVMMRNLPESYTTASELPLTINQSYSTVNPMSGAKASYYPYRKELLVANEPIPTLTDILKHSYFPPMKSEDEIVSYKAQRLGIPEEEVAYEMFRMRRLKLGCAQMMRNCFKGKWMRLPEGNWSPHEKMFLQECKMACKHFSMIGYTTNSWDPIVFYNNVYMFGDMIDLVIHTQVRTVQEYIMLDVMTDKSIPKSRLPGVVGKCKPPLEHIEPSLHELYRVRASILACLLGPDQHVTDRPQDTGHNYAGAFVHFYSSQADPGSVLHHGEFYKVDMDLGWTWLRYHYDNVVKPLRADKI